MDHQLNETVGVIPIGPELTGSAEASLMPAHADTTARGASTVVLDLTGVKYLNSGGIGVLITFLRRARACEQRVVGFGLAEHYRELLHITHLDRYLPLYATEAEAQAAIQELGPSGGQNSLTAFLAPV